MTKNENEKNLKKFMKSGTKGTKLIRFGLIYA